MMDTIPPPADPERQDSASHTQQVEHTASPGNQYLHYKPQMPTAGRPVLITRCRSLGDLSQARAGSQESSSATYNHLRELYVDLASARAEKIRLRSKVDDANRLWWRYRRAFRKTRVLFEEAVDPSRIDAVASLKDPKLAKLRELLELDRISLEAQSIEVTTFKRRLDTSKSQLQAIETEFLQAARQHLEQLDVQAPWPLNIDSRSQLHQTLMSFSPVDASVDPLLTQYQEQAAKVKILGQRLADSNSNYLDALAARHLRHDRDEIPAAADEELKGLLAGVNDELSRKLDEASCERDRLKAICLSKGLDVGGRDGTPFVDDASMGGADLQQKDYQQKFEELMSKVPPEAFENAEVIGEVASDNDSEAFATTAPIEKINDWMEHIPTAGPVDH